VVAIFLLGLSVVGGADWGSRRLVLVDSFLFYRPNYCLSLNILG